MNKKFDAKSIQQKLDELYKDMDLSSKQQDDKHILRYDKVAIASSERVRSEEEKERIRLSNIEYIKNNPYTEEEKKRIGDAMRDKTLEEILGEERAAAGRRARSESTKAQHDAGVRADTAKKIAATRKINGSYGTSMLGKTHKESTKEIQGKKAQVRQDLKRKLGLGRNDSVPKDLLEREYKKLGLL